MYYVTAGIKSLSLSAVNQPNKYSWSCYRETERSLTGTVFTLETEILTNNYVFLTVPTVERIRNSYKGKEIIKGKKGNITVMLKVPQCL